jgi:hypothetical protein
VDKAKALYICLCSFQGFFTDELATVYIVLRTPALSERDLKIHLSRLSISIEAHAIGQQVIKPGDAANPPQLREAKELLATETLDVSEDPMICAAEVQAEAESEPEQFIYIFWKVVMPIGRPRARLQKLSVFFTPMATLKPFPINNTSSTSSEADEDEYLPSTLPLTTNLLSPLSSDTGLGSVKPYLAASRISKPTNGFSASLKQQPSFARPIRGGPRKLFRAAPSFLWRVRFLRYPALAEKDALLAAFDLEITHFANSPVLLDKISLVPSLGSVEPIGVDLPLKASPGEQMTLIYKILPPLDMVDSLTGVNHVGAIDPLLGRTMSVIFSATVLLKEDCKPKIKLKWKTALEMPSSRPASRERPPSRHYPHDMMHADFLNTTGGHVYEAEIGPPIPNGVSISITSPGKVRVGEMFRWEVLVINRGDQVQRFAIVPIPKRKVFGDYQTLQSARPGSSGKRPGSSGSNGRPFGKGKDIAGPLMDENALYLLQRTSLMEPSDLICLSPDVRIGYVFTLLTQKVELTRVVHLVHHPVLRQTCNSSQSQRECCTWRHSG